MNNLSIRLRDNEKIKNRFSKKLLTIESMQKDEKYFE